jgi:hypothetical protein
MISLRSPISFDGRSYPIHDRSIELAAAAFAEHYFSLCEERPDVTEALLPQIARLLASFSHKLANADLKADSIFSYSIPATSFCASMNLTK